MTLLTIALVTTLAGPNTRLLVNAEWLNQHRNDKNVVVLHAALRADDYDKAHIPGARSLVWSEYVRDSESEHSELPSVDQLKTTFQNLGVSDNSTVIVYGDPLAAARAFMTLEYLGHRDVRLLDGGLPAWQKAGFAAVTDKATAKVGKLTPRPRDFVVDANWVNANRSKPSLVLIDARPLNEFTGNETHDGMHAGGHIPGAQNIYWQRFLKSREEPTLLPEGELRALFQRAGATDDKTVVVYCMIGMRASMAYFVSRYLGYDTKFYDGSWVDWSARKLPFDKGGEPVK
jgi:thiosulfate/3-mercaptopyruvate sulfurtransferase